MVLFLLLSVAYYKSSWLGVILILGFHSNAASFGMPGGGLKMLGGPWK